MAIDLAHGFRFGAFIAEPLRGCITGDDMQPRHLSPKAMEVLVTLADAAPEPVSREELINRVWGERCVSDEVLTHAITELRHALGDSPSRPEYIQTIPKRGYRLFRVIRPLASPARPRAAAGLAPAGPRRGAQGFAAIQRFPVVSVMLLAGFAAILAVVYSLQTGQDNEPPSSAQAKDAVGPGRAREPPQSFAESALAEVSELLLQARSLERRATPGNNERAEVILEKAVSIDPLNAPAWSLLGRIYYRQTNLFRSRPLQEGSELARQAIQQALSIDSKSGPAHASLALVNMTYDFDFDAAFMHLREAQDLSPTDPHVLQVAGQMEMTHGHIDHAIDLLQRSARVDPHSCIAQADLGRAYYFGNRLEDAERALEQSVLLNPEVIGTRYLLGIVRLARGKKESALATMQQEPDGGFRTAGIALALHATDDSASFDKALEDSTRPTSEPRFYHVARVYAVAGRHEEALDWLELAYNQRDPDMVYLLVDPLLVGLHKEARWEHLIDKLRLPHRI